MINIAACGMQQTSSEAIGLDENLLVESRPMASWHRVRFQWQWDGVSPPNWHQDLLLADKVLAIALSQNEKNIRLWRFHRRAKGDIDGFQFSLLIYCDRATASKVFRFVEGDAIVQKLLKSQTLLAVKYSYGNSGSEKIGYRSDQNWPQSLQESWPEYIMGVSKMWLDLIHYYSSEIAEMQNQNVTEMLEVYRQVNSKVQAIWVGVGQHALLHHLNAIFAYEPLVIKKKMRF